MEREIIAIDMRKIKWNNRKTKTMKKPKVVQRERKIANVACILICLSSRKEKMTTRKV